MLPHPRSTRAVPRLIAALLGASLVVAPSAADAFCRSTTCSSGCPTDDDGCKTTGHPLFWPSLCVGFSLQEAGTANLPMSAARAAIEAGFFAWTELDCSETGLASIAFSDQGDVVCHRAEFNQDGPNANVILFQDTKWSYVGEGNNIAKTTVTFDNDTGAILDADLELNHAYNELTVGDERVVYDLQGIVTHEIGHFIGLDHSPYFAATMNAAYEEGSTTQRELDIDDIDALCAAYPPGRAGKCAPAPLGGLGLACAGAAAAADDGGCSFHAPRETGSLVPLALAFSALAALRRRARTSTRSQDPCVDS